MKWIKGLSIRTKLLGGFSAIFLMMLLLLLALNHLFLDDYFLYKNRNDLENSTDFIDDLQVQGDKDYSEIFMVLSRDTGGEVVIYDSNLEVIDSNVSMEAHPTLPQKVFDRMLSHALVSDSSSHFLVLGDGSYKDQRMHFMKIMPDGNFLVIDKGLGLVEEASEIFIMYSAVSSFVVYILAFIMIFMYADRFTRPIIQMKWTAEKMASLDFSEQVALDSEDEIGDLVKSINSMARSLYISINDLNATNARLEQELNKERSLEQMRRRFVADVSHELKNPISMVVGYADGICKGIAKTPEDQKYYASVIMDEGKRMNRLVKDLLDISSYESGTFTMDMALFDVAELVYSTLGRYRPKAEEKNIAVSAGGEGTVALNGDRARIEQVLINLMDNAFKHVNDDGRLDVTIGMDDGIVRIIIANTGDLIPDEDLDRIWESFYQVDTDAEGNGLGLTIVKRIVELHKGSVEVRVEGDMNVFEVVLPMDMVGKV